MAGNELAGPIPQAIERCTALVTVLLQNNRLSGKVPRTRPVLLIHTGSAIHTHPPPLPRLIHSKPPLPFLIHRCPSGSADSRISPASASTATCSTAAFPRRSAHAPRWRSSGCSPTG